MQKSDPRLRAAAFVTWLAVGAPLLFELIDGSASLTNGRVQVWLVAYLTFGVCVAFGAETTSQHLRHRAEVSLTLLQMLAAAVAVFAVPFVSVGIPANAILFVICAARVAWWRAPYAGFAAVAAQTTVLGFAYNNALATTGGKVLFLGAYGGFQLFAFYTARLAIREADARSTLATTVAELEATRELVTASGRLAERNRISRELHDSLGHHLTALSMNLELAQHQDGAESAQSVQTAHSLCRLLLADLRDVLEDVAGTDPIDLVAVIQTLVESIPAPKIAFEACDSLPTLDPSRAHALLRATQEIITNAIRHSGADQLELALARDDAGLVLTASDNGRGFSADKAESGLRGLRERVTDLGGALTVGNSSTKGARIQVTLPLESQASDRRAP